MKYLDNIKDVHMTIGNDSKFEAISNEFYVWQENEKYIIEKKVNSKKGWKVYLHKDIVRAIRILYRENLIFSPFYKMFVGYDFLRIEVDKKVNIHSIINKDYKTIVANIKKIQQLLFCKSKFEEAKEQNIFEEVELDSDNTTKIWIYPLQKINGIYISVDKRMTKLLKEIVDFAKLNSIDIILGEDEERFFQNPIVKEKLVWEDYIFDYQTGVCAIFFERYPHPSIQYSNKKYPFIKKIPDICWITNRKLEFTISNEKDQDYLLLDFGYGGFEDWKTAITTFIKEKNEYNEYYAEKNKSTLLEIDISNRSSHSSWEPINYNPYYNNDIETDEQSPEFWDSI